MSHLVTTVEGVTSQSILWVRLSKEIIGFDIILGSAYIPHEGSPYYDADEFEIISEDIIFLKSKFDCAICICGDFNARTGHPLDFVTIGDIIVKIVGDNSFENDIFLNRNQCLNLCVLNQKDIIVIV